MITNTVLSKAMSGTGDPPLLPLPDRVAELLSELGSPPRLAAHLRAVHDVAHQLVCWVEQHYPSVVFDREAVLFGAATHDMGKTVHLAELSGPGSAHEETGQALLLERGVSPEKARFAATHASWTDVRVGMDDLLVSLADKIWKNKRVPDLEDLVVARLAEATGRAAWEEFIALDGVLSSIGDAADERLVSTYARPVACLPDASTPLPGKEMAGRLARCASERCRAVSYLSPTVAH